MNKHFEEQISEMKNIYDQQIKELKSEFDETKLFFDLKIEDMKKRI